MAEGLFRKAAIDKVSSPEQLDLLMRVTSPVGWIALLTVALMLTAVGTWSVLATIPDLVDGNGTLFRGERLYDVKATMSGNVMTLDIRPGTVVTAGQTLATLERERTSPEELEATARELGAIRADIAKSRTIEARESSTLGRMERELKVQNELVNAGIKAPNEVRRIEREMDGVRGTIDSLRADIVAAQAKMIQVQARMRSTVEVKSPESGTVVEVIKSVGDKVNDGEALMRVEQRSDQTTDNLCGGDVHALVYVSATSAGKVKKGDVVRVSPTGVEKERYGFIFGKVEWVASYPASTADMSEKLKNDQLVRTFSGSGPVFETRICLDKAVKENAVNRFRWSSSDGPPGGTEAGTTCTASMVVDQKKPYTYVIPAVRRAVGI